MLNKQQLLDVIASVKGNEEQHLILNTDGIFEIVKYHDEEDPIEFEKMNYVTRWGTSDEGNGYIGGKTADDKKNIGNIMSHANKAWAVFLNTGKTRIISIT
ncbi:hypothetical protein Amet_3465 [Alkaliphilus metalliredigens QYMF]|uniref:Uncharacterized protein n=1 Tax=Alkaliphilus metalliredigens (strain QYMF) TaxID=293826 RepID=A6TTS5_ALKMQ|nr:hypothetical protein [Alkaliphilus metalliredigens]ABR49593.1 hypothetical protein Amet_3465 [Alkaliphilus metalliredigens QYMF]